MGNASQVHRLREYPIHRCAVPLPQWGRLRGGGFAAKKEANPASQRSAAPSKGRGSRGSFLLPEEGGENAAFPILSFRAKARNLFRLRSGKGCEDSGEREAPCSQRIGRTVFHADSITKENGNGKRKRSLDCARDDETRERLFPLLFNLLRKPPLPRCARQPLPKEGARVDAPSFLWKEVPRRGGGWMGKAVSSTQSLSKWGRLQYENIVFLALSFRAKARNLFRLRSGKGCEDSGEREAPCSQRIGRTVFHADSITKENGNGKRKRSLGCARDDETRERLFPFLFNLLRKPTPPRCARQPLPREGARVDAPSLLWGRLRNENTAISFLPHFLDLSILFSCRLRS